MGEVNPLAPAENAIWVEILSRLHDVAARYRSRHAADHDRRAYDNDIVVDDILHVAAHHLRSRSPRMAR